MGPVQLSRETATAARIIGFAPGARHVRTLWLYIVAAPQPFIHTRYIRVRAAVPIVLLNGTMAFSNLQWRIRVAK